ncbi:MAG TPA: glycoside hydrolase family 2 TIM barrel-domain containing protein [Terriglobia bacterium]|nr:glycoside hydrolase family 2 TIM barrel-domain containing protein [Terriglobia bacterium]
MDRREFLETVAAGAATTPLVVQSAETTGAGTQTPAGPGQPGTSPRVRENFNRGWLFARQSHGTGALGSFDRQNGEAAEVEPRFRNAYQPEYDDSSWDSINLPHTWNQFDSRDETPGYWRGIGWYRKHFLLGSRYSGKRVFLEFEAASSVAECWLNGQRVGEHKGGYTSFEFDVTGYVKFGEAGNVLTVKVDNLFRDTLPPTVKTDYTFYGGIYRDVWLRLAEPTYISEAVWLTPSVSESAATLQVRTRLVNTTRESRSLTLEQQVLDPRGEVAKTFSLPVQIPAGETLEVAQDGGTLENPLLWSPGAGMLYRLRSSLRDGSRLVDVVENPLGFRWFKFDPQQGFFLNGKRVQVQGTNWHQVYPGMGNALPNSRHARDMEIMRVMGVNFWRTSHYPHDPATMEASDRLGLMVWEELPVNKEIGDTREYIANVEAMAEEMIRRDRNHPCIIVWGIAGEVNAPLSVAKKVVGVVAARYRQLDPSRPVGMHEPRGEEIEALVDVVGLGVGKETDEKHRRFPNRPFLVAEYSASTMGRGIYGGGPESEELACENHEKYLRELNQRPWMAGGMIWHQFDYEGETYDTVIPHIVAFGMGDIYRIPKDAYYFYQSQWTDRPMVHILGHWTWPEAEGKERIVKVVSNAAQVELVLNGKSLGIKSDARDAELLHPPRVWMVRYEPGTLEAVAMHHGEEVRDQRRTAGAPHHLVLEADAHVLESGKLESLAYITARAVDENGTLVPSAALPITFTSDGPGELLRQSSLGHGTGWTLDSVAGIAQMAFRATDRTGHATVSAYSPGLRMGRIEISVQAQGKPDEMEYKEHFDVDEP